MTFLDSRFRGNDNRVFGFDRNKKTIRWISEMSTHLRLSFELSDAAAPHSMFREQWQYLLMRRSVKR